MSNKEKKNFQLDLAKKNIDYFFNLIETNFNENFNGSYVREILRLSQGFNIRLKREQKLKFCKKCHTIFNVKTREIRFDKVSRTKSYICKNCGCIRRFKY